MAYVVSLACFFAALVLLHRLTVIEIGERYARPVLMLLAFFPTAFFFGIPYSESMFLLLAVAAFLAARMGRWAIAGVILALASATRVPGLLLIIPVALLYLYGPRADREPPRIGGSGPGIASDRKRRGCCLRRSGSSPSASTCTSPWAMRWLGSTRRRCSVATRSTP